MTISHFKDFRKRTNNKGLRTLNPTSFFYGKKKVLKNQDFSIVVLGLTFINKLKKSNDEQKIYYTKVKSKITKKLVLSKLEPLFNTKSPYYNVVV